MTIEAIDPWVEKMAEVGLADSKYQRMVYHTENETEDKFLEEDSELKKAGVIRKHLSIFQCSNGAKLLVRNSEEVVVPQQARQAMLTEPHSTHMSSDGMKRLARGKFYWAGMSKEIEHLYMSSEWCKENSRS